MAVEISKSRMAIIRALESEMEETPLDKVKVTHVCRAAGVPRSTFYEYFTDIYDVANWLWEVLQQDGLLAIGDTLNYHDGIVQNFKNFYQFKNFFTLAARSKAYDNVMDYAQRKTHKKVLSVIETRLGRSLSEEESIEFKLYSYGGSEIAKEWIRDGMETSPELIAGVLDKDFPEFFKEILDPESQS